MKIIVFDVDETLGAFFEFSKYCEKSIHTSVITYEVFRYLLNINPIYLQTNILIVLEYIKVRKDKNCKVVMFTNNQGPRKWIEYIKTYFNEKLQFELFDKIIYAKKYEPKRKEESKCILDFWECTEYPPSSKVLFIDDQKHPYMLCDSVTYIHIPAYRIESNIDISHYLIQYIHDFLY